MAAGPERLRLFFAVPLAEPLRDGVCALQEELARNCRARVKWVERPNLHLTLKFLGDMPADALPELCRVGQEVAGKSAPMTLDLAGVGCFPPRGAPRIIWLGTAGECPELAELAQRLDAALAEAGLAESDNRPFTGHFTLGRVRDDGGRGLREAILALAGEPVGSMDVDAFTLISSDLTRSGPVYTERQRFRLGC